MQVAVLGTGSVGRAIAPRLAELGHSVRLGTRDPAATRARDDRSSTAASPVVSQSRPRIVTHGY
jgi:3-hydroxyisobutyrate dehydrogenase-like beta-hydroxyacid dehydrogenase